jgi:hypothetical protein
LDEAVAMNAAIDPSMDIALQIAASIGPPPVLPDALKDVEARARLNTHDRSIRRADRSSKATSGDEPPLSLEGGCRVSASRREPREGTPRLRPRTGLQAGRAHRHHPAARLTETNCEVIVARRASPLVPRTARRDAARPLTPMSRPAASRYGNAMFDERMHFESSQSSSVWPSIGVGRTLPPLLTRSSWIAKCRWL